MEHPGMHLTGGREEVDTSATTLYSQVRYAAFN